MTDSCTLSISMLGWFEQRASLPGRGPAKYERTDTATFRDIYGAARVVENDCLLPTRRPGWDAVGKAQYHSLLSTPLFPVPFPSPTFPHQSTMLPYIGGCTYLSNNLLTYVGTHSSIGVFLWATDSEINHNLDSLQIGLPNVISPNASGIATENIASTK